MNFWEARGEVLRTPGYCIASRVRSTSPLAWRLLNIFAEDIAFAQDLDFLGAELDIAAGVFAIRELVTLATARTAARAVVEQFARPGRDDDAGCGFCLALSAQECRPRFSLPFERFDDNTIIERLDLVFFFAICEFLMLSFQEPHHRCAHGGLDWLHHAAHATHCRPFPFLPCRPFTHATAAAVIMIVVVVFLVGLRNVRDQRFRRQK